MSGLLVFIPGFPDNWPDPDWLIRVDQFTGSGQVTTALDTSLNQGRAMLRLRSAAPSLRRWRANQLCDRGRVNHDHCHAKLSSSSKSVV